MINIIKKLKKDFICYLRSIPYHKDFPKNVILQITVPRTGSTWLFDSLRVHPNINFIKRQFIHQKLQLSANRYPSGLVNLDIDGQKQKNILLYPANNEEVRIPDFTPQKLINEGIEHFQRSSYAIEKIHPDFYDYNDVHFEKRLMLLKKRGVRIKPIYQVRNPRDAIFSFLKYKERDPEWVTHLEINDIPDYFLKQYKSIYRLMNMREGIVIDYNSLSSEFSNTLQKIFTYLWKDLNSNEQEFLHKIVETSLEYTNRKKRAKDSNSKFLSKKPLDLIDEESHYAEFFKKHEAIIIDTEEIHKDILKANS